MSITSVHWVSTWSEWLSFSTSVWCITCSFTVSNVGTFGIESFTPVVNPPQTGILGVNSLETRIKLGKDGEIIPYTAMALSLSYDHRALDGAPASRFLKDLKDYLENFSVNLMADSI